MDSLKLSQEDGKMSSNCNQCVNKGKVNGLSQETLCESCVWYGSSWKQNHFKKGQPKCAVIYEGEWDPSSIYEFHDHFDFVLSDRRIKYDENYRMKGHFKITIEYNEEG